MLKELKCSLIHEMERIVERLNKGYHIDFTDIVDKIYYINSIVFHGIEEGGCYEPQPVYYTTPTEEISIVVVPVKYPPTITTDINTISTSSTTIISGGTITSDGGDAVITRGVCWIEAVNSTGNPTITDNRSIDGSGSGSFTSNITDLSSGKSYHIRAYATNSIGTSYGEKRTIPTLVSVIFPIVSTADATTITSSSINIGGSVISQGSSSIVSRGVCWSESSQNPTIQDRHTSDGIGEGEFTSVLTGLSNGTMYYIKAYARNSQGTAYGNIVNIATLPVLPEITTNSISSITDITAISGGNVISDGGSPVTQRGVCWDSSPQPTTSGMHTSDGSGLGTFTSQIWSLFPGSTYYVRAYAVNNAGLIYGNEISFTSTVDIPTVTTSVPHDITLSSVISGGNVVLDGGSSIIERGVCWGSTAAITIQGYRTIDGSGIGNFISTVDSLRAGVPYYIKAYATNSAGLTGYGDPYYITTLTILPSVQTSPISGVTSTSLVSGGSVYEVIGKTITDRGVVYWTDDATIDTDGIYLSADNTDISYTSTIGGLTADTLYFVKAYIICDGTAIYGELFSKVTLVPDLIVVTPVPYSPTVVDHNSTSITVVCTGTSYNGGGVIDEIGFIIKKDSAPSIIDGKVIKAIYNVAISHTFTGLDPASTYYISSFVHNSNGYGLSVAVMQLTNASIIYSIPTISIKTLFKGPNYIKVRGTVIKDGNSTITQTIVCMKTAPSVLITDNPHIITSIDGIFDYQFSGLTPTTNYYFKAFAINDQGTGNSLELLEPTSDLVPGPYTVTANNTLNSTYNTITPEAQITGTFGNAPSERGFIYGTTLNPDHIGPRFQAGQGSTPTPDTEVFSLPLTGLLPNTTYFIYAYAMKAFTYWSDVIIVATRPMPIALSTVNLGTVTNLSSNSFSISANIITNGGGTILENGFCFSIVPDIPTINNSVKITLPAISAGQSYIDTITDLLPGTTYNIKAYVKNELGIAYSSSYLQVTTISLIAPRAITSSLTPVSYTQMQIVGTVNTNDGTPITEQGYYWAPSVKPPVSLNDSNANKVVTTLGDPINIAQGGLYDGHEYTAAAFATNSLGLTAVAIQLFTNIPLRPVVNTKSTYTATMTTLTVDLTVTPGAPSTVVSNTRFYWSLTPFDISSIGRAGVFTYTTSGLQETPYTITGLTLDTFYYVRAAISVTSPFLDLVLGQQQTMLTLAVPPPPPLINVMKDISIGAPSTKLNYTIYLSNATSSSIYYALRMRNVTQNSAWFASSSMKANIGDNQVSHAGSITGMSVSNTIGDLIDVQLSNDSGATWTALLQTDYPLPVSLPYVGAI